MVRAWPRMGGGLIGSHVGTHKLPSRHQNLLHGGRPHAHSHTATSRVQHNGNDQAGNQATDPTPAILSIANKKETVPLCTARPSLEPLHCHGDKPTPRSGHVAVCDEEGVWMYVFGGYHDGTCFNDLHRLHLKTRTWQRLATTGCIPTERVSHAAVLLGDLMYVFGGSNVPFGQTNSNTLFVLNLSTLAWSRPHTTGDTPSPRYGHTMVHRRGSLYVFGGTSGCVYHNDMYRLDVETLVWSRVVCEPLGGDMESVPAGRYRHEAVCDDTFMYVVGGGTPNTLRTPVDVFVFHFDMQMWRRVECEPSELNANAQFPGGAIEWRSAAQSRTDYPMGLGLHEGGSMDFSSGRLSAFIHPIARRSHTLILLDGSIYMHGGTDGLRMFEDLWRLDVAKARWCRLPLGRPWVSGRCFHAGVLTPEASIYYFGGCEDSCSSLRSNKVSYCHLKMPSLRELCLTRLAQGVGACTPRQRDILNRTIPQNLLPHIFVNSVK